MISRREIVAIFFLLGLVSSGICQNSLSDTLRIGTVNVRAGSSQETFQMQKLDSLELQNNPGGNLADLLNRNTPVFIKRAAPGSLATISMRGTLASHTQVNWNGIKINSPMLGQADFTLIPTFFTDQVEIFSGPGSLLGGSGALGGQINLASQGKWDKPFFGSLAAGMGSFQTNKWMLDLGGNSPTIQTRIRLFRTKSKNNFPFLNTANGLFNYVDQKNSEYFLQGGLAQVFFRPNSRNLVSLNAWIQMSDRNLPPIMSYEGSGREEFQIDKQIRLSAAWQYIKGAYRSKLISGLSHEKMQYYLAHNTGGGLLINYNSNSLINSIYNNYTGSLTLGEVHSVQIHLNADYHQVEINDEKSASGYTADRLESGVQIKAVQKWNSRTESYFLVQQDWNRNQKNPTLPGFGIVWKLLPSIIEIHGSAVKNYHLPTLNDLYWIPGGNPDLLPEEGYLADLGIQSHFKKDSLWAFDLKLTAFVSYINNWILWKPGEFQYWSPENLESVLARGLETRIQASRTYSHGAVLMRGNYTYTKTNQTGRSASRSQLIYIPIHKANCLLHFKWKGWFLQYAYDFTSERFTSTEPELSLHSLPAFSLSDISLGRSLILNKFMADISFEVLNLFNTDYQSILWRAMPGRNYNINMKIQF